MYEIVNTISAGSMPCSIKIENGFAYVSNGISAPNGKVIKIDMSDFSIVGQVDGLNNPRGLAIDDGILYVATETDNKILKIDLSLMAAIDTYDDPFITTPWGLTIDNGYLYASSYNNGQIMKIDLATKSVAGMIGANGSHRGLAIHNGFLYVANENARAVTKVDLSDNSIVDQFDVGYNPRGLAIDNGFLYVVNYLNQGTITKIDLNDNSTVDAFDAGVWPNGVTTFGNYLYVTIPNDNNVLKILIKEARKMPEFQIKRGPEATAPVLAAGEIAFTTDTHKILVGTGAANIAFPNQDYVDAQQSISAYKQPVEVATTENISLTGEQTIDGVSVTAGMRVLVKDQTDPKTNGIYVASATAWARSADADSAAKLESAVVFVKQGTAGADKEFLQVTDGITLGTSDIVFTQTSADYGTWT